MGLLDDAIREHLDLKRRRGADPAEIERAEREALGPVRRKGGEATATAEAEPELGTLIEADQAEHDLVGAREPSETEEPPPLHFSGEEDELVDDEPLAEDDDEHATRVMRISDEPAAVPTPPEPAMSDATAEFEVEDALADDDEPSGDAELDDAAPDDRAPDDEPGDDEPGDGEEDMLEETPEFLQDTPDHDRLWFEQRPPRDFDFDG